MFMYYTACYFTAIFYAVVRQISVLFIDNKISVLFIDNKISVFCILEAFVSVGVPLQLQGPPLSSSQLNVRLCIALRASPAARNMYLHPFPTLCVLSLLFC